ncbi:MAG: hypothetical protein J0M01_15805 [Dechloromonas sp.]|jgi:hypothetical protein|nr:hypothetical protein [Dechloromonas sp.]
MKLQSALSAALLASAAMLPLGAQAGDADKAPAAAEMKAKAVKPHSHVQEKTGMEQVAPTAAPAKKNAAKDKTKHYHPRDK